MKTIKGDVNRFNLVDVVKNFQTNIQQLINLTDFLEMDFEDNYVTESNRIKDSYRVIAKNARTPEVISSKRDVGELVHDDTELFTKKLWNQDFFGITQDQVSQRDYQMSKIKNLVDDQSKLDTYSYQNILMNSVDFTVQREQQNRNNTNQMKNMLQSAQVSLEQFKTNLDPDLHPVNNSLTPSGKKQLAVTTGNQLYTVDVGMHIQSKIASSCFNDNKKPQHGSALIADSNNQVYFFGGVAGLDANKSYKDEIWRLDLATLTYEKIGKMRQERAFAKAIQDKANQEIIIIGGKNNKQRCPPDCEVYSIAKRSTEFKYSLNTPRQDFSVCWFQKKGDVRIFVLGGLNVEGKVIDSIETLDMVNRQKANWETHSLKLPVAVAKGECIQQENLLWHIGGWDQLKNHPRVDVLDPVNNKVTENYANFDSQKGQVHDKVFKIKDNMQVMSTLDNLFNLRMGNTVDNHRAFSNLKLDYKNDKNSTNTLSESGQEKFRLIELW